LFPTLRVEGLPMNVLEALGAGLPCVCSDGLEQIFGRHPSISYASATDPAQLSRALVDALARGRRAESLLSGDYSLEHCAASYIDVISRLRRQ
jgi:glycosyltransferase involved in cell wall biosynthesis